MISCRTLDSSNPTDIIAFEKAQYRAFQQSEIGSLEEIWDFDHHNKRVKSPFLYSNLLITIAEHDTQLIAAMVIHTSPQAQLQLHHFGFTIDTANPTIAEAIQYRSLETFKTTLNS